MLCTKNSHSVAGKLHFQNKLNEKKKKRLDLWSPEARDGDEGDQKLQT